MNWNERNVLVWLFRLLRREWAHVCKLSRERRESRVLVAYRKRMDEGEWSGRV